MSLISDTDVRKILKIKEDEGDWLLASFKFIFGIEKLNRFYNESSTFSGLEFIDFVINKLSIKYYVQEEFGNSLVRYTLYSEQLSFLLKYSIKETRQQKLKSGNLYQPKQLKASPHWKV